MNSTSASDVTVSLDHTTAPKSVPTAAPPRIGSKPTLVTRANLRFLIMDAPRSQNLHLYIKECKKFNVTDVVRVCEPTYGRGDLDSAGIELHEMAYDDGSSPPADIITKWLDLVEATFVKGKSQGATIAVHCVAGLGRAPVMVALALIEFGNCDPIEAVDFIRKHRRGAINNKQLQYLEQYRKVGRGGCGCVVS